MATNKSQFTYIGKIGNTRGYGRIGTTKKFIGLAGGPTKLEFQTYPSLAAMRDNASESSAAFTAAAILTKYLYHNAFNSGIFRTNGNIVRTLKTIFNTDLSNPKGKRTLQFGDGNVAAGGGFNQKNYGGENLLNWLIESPSIGFDPIAGNYGVVFPNGITDVSWRQVPPGATHYHLALVVVLMPDFNFNPTTMKYYQVQPVVVAGSLSSISTIAPPWAIPISLLIPPIGALLPTQGVFMQLCLQFAKKTNLTYTKLSTGNSSLIVKMGSS